MLQHALCLTIYEAKGLEFDDVILYNFFSDSHMEPEKWALLRHMQFQSKHMPSDEYKEMLKKQEEQREKNLVSVHELRQNIISEEFRDSHEMDKLKYIYEEDVRLHKLQQLSARQVDRQ